MAMGKRPSERQEAAMRDVRVAPPRLTSGVNWNSRWFTDYLHQLRRFELSEIVKSIPVGTKLLEIGGGTGYQAHLLQERGYPVVSVDIPDSMHSSGRLFGNVMEYDGLRLPFADASFDAALSSHVLPCVANPAVLHRELARVLRPGGFVVHVVPTHFWGLWRLALYHLFVAATVRDRLVGRIVGGAFPRHPASGEGRALSRGAISILRRCLAPKRIGAQGNILTEFWSFRPARWRGHLECNGWAATEERPVSIYHTGYRFLGSRLRTSNRRRLARLLGPSTWLFKVVPTAGPSR